MLLYLFCLGTNREEGPEVGQHSVLALPLAESLPSGAQARLLLLPGPSDPLIRSAELGGPLSLWGFEMNRHLTMGTFPPWATGSLVQGTLAGV